MLDLDQSEINIDCVDQSEMRNDCVDQSEISSIDLVDYGRLAEWMTLVLPCSSTVFPGSNLLLLLLQVSTNQRSVFICLIQSDVSIYL